MRKVLHDSDEVFFTFKEGKIHTWDSRDVDAFIEAANKGLELLRKMRDAYREKDLVDPNSEEASLIPEAFRKVRYYAGIPKISEEDSFCLSVNDFISEIADEGQITEETIELLNDFMSTIRYRHVLMPSKNGTPYWEYIADLNRQLDPAEAAAFGFAQMLAVDGFSKVKRCQTPECGHYFLGRLNAKWCSRSCGSLFRVQKKRKKDQARGRIHDDAIY